jgi:hypothetical protein
MEKLNHVRNIDHLPHSSQNHLFIFCWNEFASECATNHPQLVNRMLKFTLHISQFWSSIVNGKLNHVKNNDCSSHSSQNRLFIFWQNESGRTEFWYIHTRIGRQNAKITLDITQFWSLKVNGKLDHLQILTPSHILARIIF